MRQLEPSSDTLIKRLLPTEESPRIKLRTIRENPNLYFKEIRAIPEELCDNNSFRIWDDCINIVSFDEDNNYIIITIKDKYVAQMMKNMFDFIWFNCKKD
jgi:hypothetical protein